MAGPAAKVLVGEEEDLGAALQGPLWRWCRRSTRCTRCPVVAAEGLEIGGRVDVGDRRYGVFDVDHGAQFAPAAFDLARLAMSAIEQPAARSGRMAIWLGTT